MASEMQGVDPMPEENTVGKLEIHWVYGDLKPHVVINGKHFRVEEVYTLIVVDDEGRWMRIRHNKVDAEDQRIFFRTLFQSEKDFAKTASAFLNYAEEVGKPEEEEDGRVMA